MNRFQLAADHSDTYPVKRLRQVIDVARSSHYASINTGLRRKHRTTIAEPTDTTSPDLLNRDVTATAPNTRYAADITYLPCGTVNSCISPQ